MKKSFGLLAAIQGVLIVVVALVFLEVTSLIQYSYSKRIIREEAHRNAFAQLEKTETHIESIMDLVETAVRNNMWSARELVTQPDSLWGLTRGIVKDNPIIYGSAVALVKDYQKSKVGSSWYSPYSWRDASGVIQSTDLAREEGYDYFQREWFADALGHDEGYWTEPYIDEAADTMLMTTYSIPVRDHRGKIAAILTSDVSMDWLTEKVGNVEGYKGGFSMLVSRSGRIMMCPQKELVMSTTIQELAIQMPELEGMAAVNDGMLAGKSGSVFVHNTKKKGYGSYVYYDPVERTGWSLCVIIPEEEMFAQVKRVATNVLVMQVLGILMLILILWATIRSQSKMQSVEANKNRIEGELKVARGIQMAMVPKSFPPFPSRSDVDIFATIVPAKEVGGDLYDFYVRDEKLFFCIGDVSGKGVPASLVMAVTRSLFRTVSAHEMSPARIVASMNESMADMNEANMFVTLFFGILDMRSGYLTYCNCGHNAPYVVSDGKMFQLAVEPNLPLGVVSGAVFKEQETMLPPGSGLFLYTDGVTEAENPTFELFGEKRLEAALDGKLCASEQVKAVTGAVETFVSGAEQSDDQTMLYIRFINEEATQEMERHLILHNDIQQIPQLADFVETVADIAHLDVGTTMSLNLALEEAVSNVILYAYPPGADGLVDVEAIIRKDSLKFIIVDSGSPFDPTAVPEADITLSAEDRPIGGLGIFLIRKIMDSVEYARTDGKNILSMIKKLA